MYAPTEGTIVGPVGVADVLVGDVEGEFVVVAGTLEEELEVIDDVLKSVDEESVRETELLLVDDAMLEELVSVAVDDGLIGVGGCVVERLVDEVAADIAAYN